MKFAIQYLKMAAADYMSQSAPNHNTITKATAEENRKKADELRTAAYLLEHDQTHWKSKCERMVDTAKFEIIRRSMK